MASRLNALQRIFRSRHSVITSLKPGKGRITYPAAVEVPCQSSVLVVQSFQRQHFFLTRNLTTNASSARSVKSIKVEVNGVNINYEQAGTGDHYVVLLPGALGGSQDFQEQLHGLNTDKYTVISFDPRGYGKSRPPERDWPLLFLHRDADDVAGLMKVLGIHQYSVLGWSDGGITGLILAAEYPQHVKRMIIWGANAYITEKDMNVFEKLRNVDSWSERMLKMYTDVYGYEYFKKHWDRWVDAYDNYYKQKDGDVCKDSLPKIQCPVLIVNGHKDALVPQEHPLYLQKHIPNCRTVDWPEGKHNLHMRYAKEFNELAEQFLDS